MHTPGTKRMVAPLYDHTHDIWRLWCPCGWYTDNPFRRLVQLAQWWHLNVGRH